MRFDEEGHIIVTPKEVHELAFSAAETLINSVLIPGTPRAVPTHRQHFELLQHISGRMGIHPNNLFFKGSTKIGFSIAPKLDKVWMAYGDASDLDLAIVDSRFFQVVDYEVDRWERNPQNRSMLFQNERLLREHGHRVYHKGKFDCFRFFDLPQGIACMEQLNDCLNDAPVEQCCRIKRSLRAFVFRDWWGVWKRYDFDIYCLTRGLQAHQNRLPPGGDYPRPYLEPTDSAADACEGPHNSVEGNAV